MTAEKNDALRGWVEQMLQTSQGVAESMQNASVTARETFGTALYEFLERGTEAVGTVVTPIATHPVTQVAVKVPGLSWLMAALGQVDPEKVEQKVAALRQSHPADSAEMLAQRAIADASWRAAAIGLTTNFVPPLALTLLAVDLGAVAALQAEMIHHIAACYGFSPTNPARRGEVMAIWLLSSGSSGAMKAGLSIVELIPLVGAVAGTASNGALLYGLGQVACCFYEAKQRAEAIENHPVAPPPAPGTAIAEPASEPTAPPSAASNGTQTQSRGRET